MDVQKIKELALANGFSLKEQASGNMDLHSYVYEFANAIEQAVKAQAVPEGFVLVPKENISCYWQDNDEPENFCNSSNDWDCLGDGIDKDQIMIVNKHTQANISTEKFYGAWKLIETSYGTRWKFELFKSESEAKQAMIEAQEPAND